MIRSSRIPALLIALGASALVAAGCGSSDDSGGGSSSTTATAAATASADNATSLKGVCPSTVVIQTDWNPESDHSELYQLAASGGDIDSAKKRYTADLSYDGKPARFVTAGGKLVQQGFITAEPWQYENQVKAWKKPVSTLKISDSGYPNYGETIAVRKEDVTAKAACLKKLVPMIQQAQVDYAKDPSTANGIIVKAAEEYNNGWVYPAALADYAAKAQVDNKIISNGDDDTLGNLDAARVQKMIGIVSPIYKKNHINIADGLAPSDLFTNEFIKKGIGL